MKKQTRNLLLLVLTAFIWGTAFVAQSEGGTTLGAFSFNGIRSFIGALVLQPAILFLDKAGFSPKKPSSSEDKKLLLRGGLLCGLALFISSSLQQFGLNLGTPAGKAGFITACYILIVPILGMFLKRKCGYKIWIGVALSLIGLYLLCINGAITLQTSDLFIFGCAFGFSVQILLVDHFSPLVDGVRMAAIEFLTVGILSLPFIIYNDIGFQSGAISTWLSHFTDPAAIIALLFAGCLSSGVAYTLQIVAQDGINPTLASMVMSLESVFSVLAGWVILGQSLSPKELIGCGLIFIAIILAQL